MEEKSFRQQLVRTPDSGDSGISDYSGGFSDCNIPRREEQFTKLRILAKHLEQDLSSNPSDLAIISQILKTTSTELGDLKDAYNKYKANKDQTTEDATKKSTKKDEKPAESRRSRIGRLSVMMSVGVMFVLFVSWMSEPRCCDSYNTLSHQFVSFSYVNGPPPI